MLQKNELADTFLNPSFVLTHCLLSYFQAPQIFGYGNNIISGIDIALPPKSQSSVKTGNFNQSCCIDNCSEQQRFIPACIVEVLERKRWFIWDFSNV